MYGLDGKDELDPRLSKCCCKALAGRFLGSPLVLYFQWVSLLSEPWTDDFSAEIWAENGLVCLFLQIPWSLVPQLPTER